MKNVNKTLQWVISIMMIVILILVLYWWVSRVQENKFWMIFIFLITPTIQFLITPIFTLLKWYTYYSPMVVSFGSGRIIDLHNGTSFDYLLKMTHIKPGKEWERTMILFYLQALLNIINQIESGKLPTSTVVRGSSYFFSERSASKFGFTVKKASLAEKVNILFNYLDLIWMSSLSKGKFNIPNISDVSTLRTTGEDLIKKKEKLIDLIERIQQRKVHK